MAGLWSGGERLLRTYCGLSLELAHGIDDEHQVSVRSFETSVRSCAPWHVERNGLNCSRRLSQGALGPSALALPP